METCTRSWSRCASTLCSTAGTPARACVRPRRVALLQCGAHQPVQLHAHAVDGGVGVQHFVLCALALVDDHHVGAALELGECVRDAVDFVAERLMQSKEVVYLGIEWWLARLRFALGYGIRSGWKAEVWGRDEVRRRE